MNRQSRLRVAMPFPDLIIFRHGQTEWNRDGIHQGQLDSPLTAMGRQQAEHIGRSLADIDGIEGFAAYTSPTGRAKTTGCIACTAVGKTPIEDPRLMEVNFGDWQGMTTPEIDALTGTPKSADPFLWNFMAPSGETLDDLTTRVRAFLDELTGPAIISTHGITSRVLRGLWLGLDAVGMRELEGGQGCLFLLKDSVQTRIG